MSDVAPERHPSRRIRPINVDEYMRLAELGMFANERVELLRGVVCTQYPQTGLHVGAVRAVLEAVQAPGDWDPDLVAPLVRRLGREEYERMADLGMFDGERVELLHGLVVTMTPQSARHMGTIRELTELLVTRFLGRAKLNVQGPLPVADANMPEPDLALLSVKTPRDTHPSGAYLVVEVALTSLATDRTLKAALYAQGGIPEYWIVNLMDQVLEVHRDPTPTGYTDIQTLVPGTTVGVLAFPDISIDVAEIVGP